MVSAHPIPGPIGYCRHQRCEPAGPTRWGPSVPSDIKAVALLPLARGTARLAWRVLLLAIPLGLLAGIVDAFGWQARPPPPGFQGEEGACQGGGRPPCFDGLPDLSSLPPELVPMLLYLLAILVFLSLSLPSLFAGVWEGIRGRWRSAGVAGLSFFGPLLLVIGTETIPHAVVVMPCSVLDPNLCSRFHQLEHVAFGVIPLTLLYRAMLLRWSPRVVVQAA